MTKYKDIFAASIDGSVEDIKQFLDNGVNVNSRNEYGFTPLHEAARENSAEIVQFLISNGADVNAKVNIEYVEDSNQNSCYNLDFGSTPLHEAAAENSDIKVFKVLLENGAEINAKNASGYTPLHAAAVNNKNVKVLKLLISNGANNDKNNVLGFTPFGSAVYGCNIPAIQYFLKETDEDINTLFENGTPALHYAIKDADVFELLLVAGANINIKNNNGVSLLHLAAMAENISMVDYLVSQGLDIHAKTNMGMTPLQLAAHNNEGTEIIQFLIDAGADLHAKDHHGNILHIAAKNGSYDVVRFLIAAGVDQNVKDKDGWIPFDIANGHANDAVASYLGSILTVDYTEVEQAEIDKFCKEYGSDVTMVDEEGRTLLHEAASYWDVPVARYLLSIGADINAKDLHGFTPLFDAISHNENPEMVLFLCHHNAIIKSENDTFEDICALAQEMGNEVVYYSLINGKKQMAEIKTSLQEMLELVQKIGKPLE